MKRTCLVALAALIACVASPLMAQPQTPIAAGQGKFLGCAYSPAQSKDFARYWNKVTPENAGKWGEVEAVRGHMDWTALDKAYHFAKSHGFPFQMHVLVWGNQQPEWIEHLPPAEQRKAIEHWFAAVAKRYPDLDYIGVVNEALNDPPSKDDEGGGNYIEALGGSGRTGWDWIITAFRMARHYFPHAKLLINDYNIVNKPDNAKRYREIVDLLKINRIVVGVDGSDSAKVALNRAIEQAEVWNAELTAVVAVPIGAGAGILGWLPAAVDRENVLADVKEGLNVAVDRALEGRDLVVRRHALDGNGAALLSEFSTAVDLVVVGSRGRGGFAGMLLGSTSQQVLHHSACPVMVVPTRVQDEGLPPIAMGWKRRK